MDTQKLPATEGGCAVQSLHGVLRVVSFPWGVGGFWEGGLGAERGQHRPRGGGDLGESG